MNWTLLIYAYICASLMVGGQWMWKIELTRESTLSHGSSLNWWFGLAKSPWIIAGLFFYVTATLFWIYLLREYRLGIAYPLIIGFALLNSTLVARFFLSEPFTVMQLFGMVLLMGSVVLITSGT